MNHSRIKLNEVSHTLQSVYEVKKPRPEIRALFDSFMLRISEQCQAKGHLVSAYVHDRGVAFKALKPDDKTKVFLMLNINQRSLSCKFFTGQGTIPGLEKGTWLYRGETFGSETVSINDASGVLRAITFAGHAYENALTW